MPGTVLNLGNTNLIGSRETHSQGELIAPTSKKDSKQLQIKCKTIIMSVPTFVTRKQLDLKHHKYPHILDQVPFLLLSSNLISWCTQICWHKTKSKLKLIWWLLQEAGNSHFTHPNIGMSITSVTNVRRVGSCVTYWLNSMPIWNLPQGSIVESHLILIMIIAIFTVSCFYQFTEK